MILATYQILLSAVNNALLPSATPIYPGIGPALRHAHSLLPLDPQEIDRLEWAGDIYLTYYLFMIVEERPRFGGSLDFVTNVIPLLATNDVLRAIMERSGLGYPGRPEAEGKQISDAFEGTVAGFRRSHTTEETKEAIRDCFLPLVVVAEGAFEAELRASRPCWSIFHPPDERYRVQNLSYGSDRIHSRRANAETVGPNTRGKTREQREVTNLKSSRSRIPDFFAHSSARNVPLPVIDNLFTWPGQISGCGGNSRGA
ncbi:hypothetical protein DXG01_007101 [Tephrocybe rancida]|nr:hypothetical protein DXG01_007101 [Tephrocybe rancida]